MLTILKKSFVLMAFILLNVTYTQAQDYYRKHIIICVDQKLPNENDQNKMSRIYSALEALLLGNDLNSLGIDPSSRFPDQDKVVFFDPEQDKLSIFVTGMRGSGNPATGDFKRIRDLAIGGVVSNAVLHRMIDSCTIHPSSTFSKDNNQSISEFLQSNVKPFFYGGLSSNEIHTGFVYYVYPLILNHIQGDKPATEYVVLIVSDFKSGGQALLKDGDEKNMKDLIDKPNSKHYYVSFNNYLNKLFDPFDYRNDKIHINFSANTRYEHNPQIKGGVVLPNALDGNSFKVENFSVQQKKWGSSEFEVNPVNILFTKDDRIKVYRIDMLIKDYAGNILQKSSIDDVNEIEKYYHGQFLTIPKRTIKLNNVKKDEGYLFSFVLYTNIQDKDGNTIIPYVFSQDEPQIPILAPEPAERKMLTIILSILTAALLIGFLIWLYIFRGKRAKPELKVDVNPISNTRYMCVKNCEETNHDCWYMEDEKDRRRIISFDITATMPKRALSQKQTYVIKYQVEDLDGNELFTFRPQLPNPDGTRKKLNTEYALEEVFDTSKKSVFEARVNVEAYVDGESNAINFDIDNVLDVKLKVRVYRRDGKSLVYIGDGEVEREYKFIVRPKLRNPNIWVAFDEGTTGSSIAYGVTGSWLDTNDINLVNRQYKETTSGGRTKTSSIFPSVIAIPDTSRAFTTKPPVEEFEEGLDFQFEGAETAGKNKFQSIKKFLGYKSPQNIKRSDGTVKTIEGQDLAHLLAKGLYNQLEAHYQSTKDENITGQFSDEYGRFDPQRAVVAVPNNYTRNKVQDMVDSVKRLGKFKEVHYLYESEGVMMTYLRQNLQQIVDKQNRVFVVLDMGGATINLTAFNVNVVMGANGNIQRIELDSLAKVGYYVGGDDIDYALIQLFYAIPSIRKALLENLNAQGKPESEQETLLREHQKKHKNALISMARKIKLDWIDKTNNVPNPADNVTTSFEDFYGFLGTQFSEFGVSIPDKTEDDRIFVANEKKSHNIMNEYVFRHITDAINELLHAKRFPSHRTIELILSGRSVLYPGVSKTIMKAFFGHRVEQWDGFMKKNDAGIVVFDDQKVKTAVAEGACWYAMYSRKILLQHNYVTSSFGFEDSKNTEKCYHALIENGTAFENGRIIAPVVHGKDLFDPEMINVKFLQMMGANTEEIIKNNIQHKKILLDEVKGSQIKTFIDRIEFEVDDKGNYDYRIYVSSFDEPITKESARAWRMDHEMQNEIKDENSAAFEFATINTNDYEEEETSFTPTHKTSTIDTSKTKTRLK